MTYNFGIGYVINYDRQKLTIDVKNFDGAIIPNIQIDNTDSGFVAPLIAGADLTTQQIATGSETTLVLYIELGNIWRKVVTYWNNPQIGSVPVFQSDTAKQQLATQVTQNSVTPTRFVNQPQNGSARFGGRTQPNSGTLASYIEFNSSGDVRMKSGKRGCEIKFDNTTQTSYMTSDFFYFTGYGGTAADIVFSNDALGGVTLAQLVGPRELPQVTTSQFSISSTGTVSMGTDPVPVTGTYAGAYVSCSQLTGTVTIGSGLVASISVEPDGSSSIKGPKYSISINPLGEISISGTTVAIGALEQVISGLTQKLLNQTFLNYFMGHTHNITAPTAGSPTTPVIAALPIPAATELFLPALTQTVTAG